MKGDATIASGLKFDTLAIHAGQPPEQVTGAVMTPVFLTSTYAQKSPGVHSGFEYSRSHNPTRFALEKCIATLEGGLHGYAFASGLAALTTICGLFESGDHIIYSDDVYGGTFRLFDKVMKRFGLTFTAVDMTNPDNVEKAFTSRTKLVWVESPTNPMLKLADIAAISALAHKHGALCGVDNTFMSPYFQSPLKLGADLSYHSTTKYINGHSDVVGGAVVCNDKGLAERLTFHQNAMGAIQSPMDSFLILRGLKTLPVRMRQHAQSAQRIAEMLEKHPKIERCVYPGLKAYPQHELAKKQMRGFGGMVTILLKSDLAGCRRFLENLRVFTLAESLGGVESLANHPAIMTHASVPVDQRKKLGILDTLVRLSVGIEDVADLETDLKNALEKV
jgi:cystathionine gamma-lyase